MAYVHHLVIALQILEAKHAEFRFVEVMFFAIMVRARVPSANVINRMEKQNITVKVVICLLHAMGIHVRMVGHVSARLKELKLRSVS